MANLVNYIKKIWKDAPSTDTPINAENLNHMEDGIYNNAQAINTLNSDLSKINFATDCVGITLGANASRNSIEIDFYTDNSKQIYYRLIGGSGGVGIKLYNYGTSTDIMWINPS